MTRELFRTTRPLPEDADRLHELRRALYDAENARVAAEVGTRDAQAVWAEANTRYIDARAALKTFLGLPS